MDQIPKPTIIHYLDFLSLPFKLILDPEVPFGSKALPIFLFLIYLVFPTDILPDFLPVIGLMDDTTVFIACAYLLVKLTPPEILQKYYPNNNDKTSKLLKAKNNRE